MEQFFSHYETWEDYKNGMYCGSFDNDIELNDKAKSLLSNPVLFYQIAKEVLLNWPIATKVNLTNMGTNRRAWIGQACCSFLHSVPEVITRVAWGELNETQRFEANTVAEKVINEYEAENFKVHQNMGREVLSKRNTGRGNTKVANSE